MPRYAIVNVPEWSTRVRIRELSGLDADELHRLGDAPRTAWVVVRCVVDADGERVFSDKDEDQVGEKSAIALRRVSEAALDLSGLTDAAFKRVAHGLDSWRRFLHRLALALGRTVEELLGSISGAELTEWAVYEEETGPLEVGRRVDAQTGILGATVANALSGKKGRRFRPDDFAPNWGARRAQTWQEQLQVVTLLNRALGGDDRRTREPRGR